MTLTTRLLIAPLVTTAVGLLAQAPASMALRPCRGGDLVPSAGNITAVQAAAACLVNRERLRRGERPLIADARLTKAARAHSRDMIVRHYFDHVSPDGQTPLKRIEESGFLPPGHGYALGENIAWGTGTLATPRQIVRSWMHSPGHRANILDRRFRYTGMGVAAGVPVETLRYQSGGVYTQDFATVFP
jgi:uncharacterized protein YkwD